MGATYEGLVWTSAIVLCVSFLLRQWDLQPIQKPPEIVARGRQSVLENGYVVTASCSPRLGVIGIMTIPEKVSRRMLIRETYPRHMDRSKLHFYFVVCMPAPWMEPTLQYESRRYGDIIIMDCAEGVVNGKTHTWFSYVYKNLTSPCRSSTLAPSAEGVAINPSKPGGNSTMDQPPPFRFVFKGDDDTFIHPPNLIAKLEELPRNKSILFGKICQPNYYVVVGMLYAVTWDVCEWIAKDPWTYEHRIGPEDAVTTNWVRTHYGDNAIYSNEGLGEYTDHPWSGNALWKFRYTWNNIAIHSCKEDGRFMDAYVQLLQGERPQPTFG